MAHLETDHSPPSSSDHSSDFSGSVSSDGDGDSNGDHRVSSSGKTDRNSSQDNTQGESSVGRESDPSSSKLIKVEKSRKSRRLVAHFFDEGHLEEKLKWLKKVATVQDDGTVKMEVLEGIQPESFHFESGIMVDEAVDEEPLDMADVPAIPPLQIVMLIVGTRGDVQPFVAIGKRLQEYGHRVRLATHANFKDFVLSTGLEFFPLGGDAKVLADYMVKNKGFFPSGPSEIHTQRNHLKDIIFSLLPACQDVDPESKIPFKADAIIANPPAYGHTQVAEALRLPLHIFFTMPWTPTSDFPHPLAHVKHPIGYRLQEEEAETETNILSQWTLQHSTGFALWVYMESSSSSQTKSSDPCWQNILQQKQRVLWFDESVHHFKCYFPDCQCLALYWNWGPKIDVVGFCFLDLASNYEPPSSLVEWLEAGERPIYIGFGSLPVEQPQEMTRIIVEALEITGRRGIINKGWGGLGSLAEPKEFVYVLDNCPHDWLFPRCMAVVHHGGAGTTSAGLKAACPTTIVPIFGDQLFWGERVHARGLGPPPIPIAQFSLENLIDAINFMLDPKVKERAVELAKAMESEDGVGGAVNAFHKHFHQSKTLAKTGFSLSKRGFSVRRLLHLSKEN
ncbi:sterol 3-beta-glucosyltransferase UGT80A2-like isoform X3 [Momordica charantia]|uniref:Sterol 3-beta-glucosyltransferase UGT80A2-like isoform X3 n=1 Tax=Momordica charantia TaxID=3673 RepID=A0A6J1DWB1_MOMCH|nr:sterol 3-beta-glucosyltransferase UGT80A2-like isoform X3 [Momordica charantia]